MKKALATMACVSLAIVGVVVLFKSLDRALTVSETNECEQFKEIAIRERRKGNTAEFPVWAKHQCRVLLGIEL